jgi:hypothetical protein
MARRNPLATNVPWDIINRFAIPPGGGGGGQAPGRERGTIAEQSTVSRIIYPPSVEKLPESVDFNAQDFALALAAAANATASSVNLRFVIPRGNVGFVQGFSTYLLTPTALTSVQFTLRINNGPVPGWSNVQNSPGVANLYREDFTDLRVRIPDGAVVDVIITNLNANGPWTTGGRIQGWFHPAEAELSRFGGIY